MTFSQLRSTFNNTILHPYQTKYGHQLQHHPLQELQHLLQLQELPPLKELHLQEETVPEEAVPEETAAIVVDLSNRSGGVWELPEI